MSYRVRDWVQAQRSHVPGVPRLSAAPDPLPETLRAALGDVMAAEYRKNPDLAAAVFLARKTRTKKRTMALSDFSTEAYLRWRHECAWCGDFFIHKPSARPQECCSVQCGIAYRDWKSRRKIKALRKAWAA